MYEILLNKNIKVVPELVVTVAVHVLKKIQDDIVRVSRMQEYQHSRYKVTLLSLRGKVLFVQRTKKLEC